MKIEFSKASYMKILSHSMKYSQNLIDGALIGYLNDQNNLIIADTFPLTHGPKLPLFITLGMQYAQGYCDILNRSANSSKFEIIGFYTGLLEETYLNHGGQKTYIDIISERLLANNKNSILVTLTGKNLLLEGGLNVYLLRNKQLMSHTFTEDFKVTKAKEQTRDLKHYNISDFEDHLHDLKPNLLAVLR